MKIWKDFVTNSSSSSFVILSDKDIDAAKEELGNFASYLEDFSIKNIVGEDNWDFEIFLKDADLSEEEFKKLGNFSDEQMDLIKLLTTYNLGGYLNAKKEMEENPLLKAYYILIDRDYLYNSPLERFIHESIIVDRQTDL